MGLLGLALRSLMRDLRLGGAHGYIPYFTGITDKLFQITGNIPTEGWTAGCVLSHAVRSASAIVH